MFQRLIALATLLGLGWLVGRAVGQLRREGAPPAAGPRTPTERLPAEEPMVRDRVCNTFLPRSRAIVEQIQGKEHFFCSEACRAKFHQGT